MSTFALYDVLQSFQEIYRVVINLAGELNDEQLHWKAKGYPTSIGFHLWHLARESDNLKAEILSHFPQIGPEFGEAIEIWQRDALAQRWTDDPCLVDRARPAPAALPLRLTRRR